MPTVHAHFFTLWNLAKLDIFGSRKTCRTYLVFCFLKECCESFLHSSALHSLSTKIVFFCTLFWRQLVSNNSTASTYFFSKVTTSNYSFFSFDYLSQHTQSPAQQSLTDFIVKLSHLLIFVWIHGNHFLL